MPTYNKIPAIIDAITVCFVVSVNFAINIPSAILNIIQNNIIIVFPQSLKNLMLYYNIHLHKVNKFGELVGSGGIVVM